jgi:ubiquinone/menaquinone biosynthesis C-methylase UbiE
MPAGDAWETLYKAGLHGSVWPWSDMVSLFMRHVRPDGNPIEVLELGVGAGANIPFVLSIGGRMSGIDRSETAIARLRERFADDDRVQFVVGDFTRSISFAQSFDVVIDRASITHNDERGIRDAVSLIHQQMKPGGWLICVTLFSRDMDEFLRGSASLDEWTRSDIESGPLAGTGIAHFWSQEHIAEVFSSFEIVTLEEHKVRHLVPDSKGGVAYYNLVARKPG